MRNLKGTFFKVSSIALFILICISILSCQKQLPDDLELMRTTFNSKIDGVMYREEKGELSNEELLRSYEDLKAENIAYVNALSARGYQSRVKKHVADFIEEKVNRYKGMIDTHQTNTCDECGRKFTGRGYTEVANGKWIETQEPYQSFICSHSCGMKHTNKWEQTLESLAGHEPYSQSSSDYSVGSDGRVYENEPCGLCGGTGVETGTNMHTGEIEGRVCPMCDGKGKRSY